MRVYRALRRANSGAGNDLSWDEAVVPGGFSERQLAPGVDMRAWARATRRMPGVRPIATCHLLGLYVSSRETLAAEVGR